MAQYTPNRDIHAFPPDNSASELEQAMYAEQQTIGALLIHGAAELLGDDYIVPEILAILKPEHFSDYHRPGHGTYARYYEAMQAIKHCDQSSLINRLKATNQFQASDHATIATIIDNTLTAYDGPAYAQQVIDFWRKRQIKYYTDRGQLDMVKQFLDDNPPENDNNDFGEIRTVKL